MEEEGEGAAGELKILSSVFRSPRAVSVRHHLSCLPGTLSLSLARERGGAEKKKTARLGAKTHFEESERECINFFLFSANDESFLLSLSLFHLNRCRSRSSGCKGSSSAAPSTIRARRAAGLGKGRRGGLLSVSFRILFFFFFFLRQQRPAVSPTTTLLACVAMPASRDSPPATGLARILFSTATQDCHLTVTRTHKNTNLEK